MNENCSQQLKWYVYQFKQGPSTVYVGKGSGNRFKTQQHRFDQCNGQIIKYFETEREALDYERGLIKTLAPIYNKAQMPKDAKHWRKHIKPVFDEQWDVWMTVLGTKQMAARMLVAKGRQALAKYGIGADAYQRMLMLIDMECFDHLRNKQMENNYG